MTKRTKFSGEFSGQKGKQEIIEVKDAAAVLKLLEADDEPLIPGLPDHVSHLCLCKIHPSLLYSVCSSWRRLIYSPLFPPFPSLYTLLAPTSATQHEKSSNQLITSPITFMNFEPISCQWSSIPSPPDPPLRLLWRHPSFISRNLPVQSLSVRNNLILLAATTHHLLPALPRPLIFNPLTQAWSHGPALKAPRRWCAAGGVRGKLYVAVEDKIDDEISALDRLDIDDLEALRERRLRQMKKMAEKRNRWISLGHGDNKQAMEKARITDLKFEEDGKLKLKNYRSVP